MLFVFTENVNSLEDNSTRTGGGTAVVRGAGENVFPIVTKKRYVYKEQRSGKDKNNEAIWNQNFNETKLDAIKFKDINTDQLNELETLFNSGKYETVVFPGGFASDKAALLLELVVSCSLLHKW